MIVILNGPPGSGKDTIANGLLKAGVAHAPLCFKDELYIQTASRFKLSLSYFIALASDRETKEEPCHLLGGMSPREALIDTSERIIKPKKGKDYFGRKVAEVAAQRPPEDVIIISDGGFKEEIEPLLETHHRVVIIHLHRPGCTFDGDSRSYINVGGAHYDCIVNDGTIDEAVEAAERIIRRHHA
jgi:Ni2+-binding GTPase involved in maturation of urease and hydrogenase